MLRALPEKWTRPFGVAVVALLAVALVLAPRHLRWLERIELPIHDALMQRLAVEAPPPNLAVVLETESDLQRFGHPLSDETFHKLLVAIEAQEPALIVVDKYRDLPVAPGSEAFARYLAGHDNILWVSKHGEAAFDGVRPPKVLEGSDRVGCADVPIDSDGKVRRYMLVMGGDESLCPSLGYLAAARWLAQQGKASGFDESGKDRVHLGGRPVWLARASEGPYVAEDVRGYQVALQFTRASPLEATVTTLLEDRLPAEALRGRIVFLGASAVSLRDNFDVPPRATHSRPALPGVVVHALATAELLDAAMGGERVRLPGETAIAAAAALMAIACAWLVLSPMRIPMAALAATALVVAWVPASMVATRHGWILAPMAPMMAGALALFLGAGWRAWHEAQQRAELMGWFSKHVSREVAEAIWTQREAFATDGRIPPRKVQVTVLFADIRSYTTISEQLSIPVMVDWINRSISQMVAAVMENQGVVTRFAGDQVMAVFGVPIPRHDDAVVRADAVNAVRAGLAMGDKLARHNAALAREGLPPARVRVGIFSGEVVQAGLGSADRFEFTVLGDVVNTASRLESFSTEDDGAAARVLIGAPTRALVGEVFELAPLGAQKLKGKDELIEIFRVLGTREPSKGTS